MIMTSILWRVVTALAEFYIGGLGSDSEKGSDQPDILIGGFSILVYTGSLSDFQFIEIQQHLVATVPTQDMCQMSRT